MGKQHLLVLALILVGSSAFAACSSDAVVSSGGAGEAGAKGEAGATGVGEGGEAGSAEPTPPAPLLPQGVVVPAAAPTASNHLLVGGTDFFSATEIVSVALDTGKVGNAETYTDGDTVAASSAGLGFALERTNDKLHVLNAGKIETTIDLREAGTDTAPVENKAYVPFLGQSSIAIVDLTAGKVSRRIDLSEYDAAIDGDKSVDIADAVYDPNQKIVYFALQRIDRSTIVDPKYQLACNGIKGLIVGIDATTDEIVDLNGAAAGKAIELTLVNQNSLSVNADGTFLYMLAAGCYEDGTLKNQGVEVVDLSDGSSTAPYAPEGTDYLAKLILIGGNNALLGSFDSLGASHWNTLDIASGMLVGEELANVPQAVTFDGTDLLGVRVDKSVGSVVRYAIATGKSTVVSKTSWVGDYSAASSSALVE